MVTAVGLPGMRSNAFVRRDFAGPLNLVDVETSWNSVHRLQCHDDFLERRESCPVRDAVEAQLDAVATTDCFDSHGCSQPEVVMGMDEKLDVGVQLAA